MNEELTKQFNTILRKTRGATLSDLEEVVVTFLSAVKELKASLEKKANESMSKVEEHKGQYSKDKEYMNKCMSDMEEMIKEIDKSCKEYSNTETSIVYNKIKSEIEDLKESIPSTPDLSQIDKRFLQITKHLEDIESKKDDVLEAKEVRDSLESINIEEEKLKIEAIGFLRKELDEIKYQINSISLLGSRPIFGASKNRFIDDETPSGTKNGSNTTFTLSKVPLDNSLKLYRGGARQRKTEDYTISGRTITFIVAPLSTEILLADYRY